jgi:GT2 family glycosyltransferase
MSVLVGIVSRNRAGILPRAIDSALQQQGVDLKVAVYDDNSTDNTKTLESKYPQVEWKFGEETKGYLFARNMMMKKSGFDYYCSLDDDSWFTTPHDLATAVAYLDANPEVGAVAFDILSPDRPDRQPTEADVQTSTFIGCGHVLRLKHVAAVNYYEPNPGSYGGEEIDMSLSLLDKGHPVMLLPGVHVWHDKTKVARDILAQHRSGVCNDLVFAYRRTPGWMLLPIIAGKVMSHVLFALRTERGRFLRAGLLGIIDFAGTAMKGSLKRRPVRIETLRQFKRLLSDNHAARKANTQS